MPQSSFGASALGLVGRAVRMWENCFWGIGGWRTAVGYMVSFALEQAWQSFTHMDGPTTLEALMCLVALVPGGAPSHGRQQTPGGKGPQV